MENTASEDVVQQAARALLTADCLAAALDPQLAARIARGSLSRSTFKIVPLLTNQHKAFQGSEGWVSDCATAVSDELRLLVL